MKRKILKNSFKVECIVKEKHTNGKINSKIYSFFPSILSQYSTLPRRKRNGIFVAFSSLYSLSQKKDKCCVAKFEGTGAGSREKDFAGSCVNAIFLLIALSAGSCACTVKSIKESNKNIAIVFNIRGNNTCNSNGDN